MSRNIQLLISEEFAERKISDNDSVRLLDEIIDGTVVYSAPFDGFNLFNKIPMKKRQSPLIQGSLRQK
jgi:hypothetical protein